MPTHNVVALVMLRGASQRLPEKHMRMVGDCTLLEHLLRNLSGAKLVTSIQLCIPRHDIYLRSDQHINYIADLTKRYPNVMAYEALTIPEDNIGGRIVSRASYTHATQYVIVSGDCPLIDGAIVDHMITQAQQNLGVDYVNYDTTAGTISHIGVDVINAHAVGKLGYNTNICMDCYPGLVGLKLQLLFPQVAFRATVDNHADLYFMQTCNTKLDADGKALTYANVADLVAQTPTLLLINPPAPAKVLPARRRYALVTHGDGQYGMGHVARTIAHAQHLTEVGGHAVHIVVNADDRAINMLTQAGYAKYLDYTVKPDHMRAVEVISPTFSYDVLYHDTPWQCWIDGNNGIDIPAMLTNRRIPYLAASGSAAASDAVVTFGQGAYAKYAAICVDRYCANLDYIVPNIVPFSTLIAMMANTKAVYTMWSQSCREALALGGPKIYCLTANQIDDNICSILDQHGVLTWLGNVSQFKCEECNK